MTNGLNSTERKIIYEIMLLKSQIKHNQTKKDVSMLFKQLINKKQELGDYRKRLYKKKKTVVCDCGIENKYIKANIGCYMCGKKLNKKVRK